MPRHVLVVFQKELRDALRDRRSLLSAAMYAVWAPLVVALALSALARDRLDEAPLTLAVVGHEHAPSLLRYLEGHTVAVVRVEADPAAAVRAGQFDVALAVDADYRARFAGVRPAPVAIYYDGARTRSIGRAERLRDLLAAYSRDVAETRLLLRGLTPEVTAALAVHERDVSTAAGRAARVLAMLPLFLLLSAFVGGMNVAIDTTAGERERGSLESLLLQPVAPLAISAGKWLAAAVVSAATVALMIGITIVTLGLPLVRRIDLPIGLAGADAASVLLVLLPLALAAPALQMLVSVFARSYKEAQTQVSLLLLVPMLPGFLAAFGSLGDSATLALMPILSQQLLVTDVLAGRAVGTGEILTSALPTAGLTAAALLLTARLLAREHVLRGSA